MTQHRFENLVADCITNNAQRAWRLAASLVGDAHEAYDVVQKASMVLARKADKIPRRNPWPWFRGIIINEARNHRRKLVHTAQQLPTTPEGQIVEFCDPTQSDPSMRAEFSESSDRLRVALDSLSEAQREAIVLTAINGLTHREAAKAMGLPVKTLSSHVKRGIESLRAKSSLREATLMRCLPLITIIDPPGGMSSATAAWVSAGKGALASAAVSATIAGSTAGAGFMASKGALVATTVVALTAGALGGKVLLSDDNSAELDAWKSKSIASQRKNDDKDASIKRLQNDLEASNQRIANQNGALAKLRDDLKAEREKEPDRSREIALAAEVQKKNAEIADLKTRLATRETTAKPTFVAKFGFGDVEGIEAIRDANWAELSKAASEMQELTAKLVKLSQEGESDPALNQRIQELNMQKLVPYAMRLSGKVPTNVGQINGEYTHPISNFMIIRTLLADKNDPLSESQLSDAEKLGKTYSEKFDRVSATYTDTTLKVTKILDEYKLKLEYSHGLYDLLSSSQRRHVYGDETTRGWNMLDMYSPLIMTYMFCAPLQAQETPGKTARELLKPTVQQTLKHRMQLEDHELTNIDHMIEAWFDEVEQHLTPINAEDLTHFHEEQAAVFFKASNTLFRDAVKALRFKADEPRMESLKNLGVFLIPRLIKADESK